MTAPVVVWFRQDLRLADNPALREAAATGAPVIPLFILDDAAPGAFRAGGAGRWWLHNSLTRLAQDLAARGIPLLLRRGAAELILPGLVAETGAGSVFWNRLYEPWAIRRDSRIKAELKASGVAARSFNASLLFEPADIRTGKGEPYRVFTPFWHACLAAPEPALPEPAPPKLRGAAATPAGDCLESWSLLPTAPDWAGGLREAWQPGEGAALKRLEDFARGPVTAYGQERDRPDHAGTSRLSPHLHWGEIGPRQVWHGIKRLAPDVDTAPFLRELGWREFSQHLLAAFPDLPTAPLVPGFADFPWRHDESALRSWQRGLTGYPIVDAGMRELWQTGWMHNRVRMVVASFLVKHLLAPWQDGARWFWDTLVDADLANNAASWQWVAGCGADAAPYFRIFNPMLQGTKFDSEGDYVRRYVPELAALPTPLIHRPWDAPADLLRHAGIQLGKTYPQRIVDHGEARLRALDAYARLRREE